MVISNGWFLAFSKLLPVTSKAFYGLLFSMVMPSIEIDLSLCYTTSQGSYDLAYYYLYTLVPLISIPLISAIPLSYTICVQPIFLFHRTFFCCSWTFLKYFVHSTHCGKRSLQRDWIDLLIKCVFDQINN